MQITPPPLVYGFPKYQVCLYKPGNSNDNNLVGLSLDCNNDPYFDGEIQVEHCAEDNDGVNDYQLGNFNKYILYTTIEQDLCADCTPENPNKIQLGDLVQVKDFGGREINGTVTDIVPYADFPIGECSCEIYFESKNT